jgi:hypothetical protein
MRATALLTAEHDMLINPARRPPHPFSKALPVCASRFRPMVKTYVLCPGMTPMTHLTLSRRCLDARQRAGIPLVHSGGGYQGSQCECLQHHACLFFLFETMLLWD